MTKFEIKIAKPEDGYAIARVHLDTWRDAYAGLMPADFLAGLDLDRWAEQRMRRLTNPGPFTTLVATRDGEVAGFATFGPYRIDPGADGEPQPVEPDVGEVIAIYVHPDEQGLGAGRALMDAAMADLTGRGVYEVRLWVLEDNAPSRRFYERCGFAPDGQRDTFRVHAPSGPVDLYEIRYAIRVGR